MSAYDPPSEDVRLTQVRHLDLPCSFPHYESRQAWLARAAELRRHILVSAGLWPVPDKTSLNARVFDRIERDGYSVEKVYFESLPGLFVAGNLYRPRDGRPKHPGILNPHGHHPDGRFAHDDAKSVPGRCINLARQGHVAFSYDMVGYNDSNRLPHDHALDGQREQMWGLSLMGLQLWNSIRSVDFLCSLPDVDPARIACTGASGGGTQTFLLTAVDDRVKVAVPVVMVSAYMQGGCLCENAPNLRVETYNVEIAALAAPRPLLLVAATGDWTRDNPTVECPDIRSVYALFGAQDRFDCVQFQAGHNYNRDSREAMYGWMARWLLGITDEQQVREQAFEVEDRADLRVWDGRKRPRRARDAKALTEYLIKRNRRRIRRRMPHDRRSLLAFRREMEVALRHSLMAEQPSSEEVVAWHRGGTDGLRFKLERLVVGRRDVGDRIPAAFLVPRAAREKGPATLVVHDQGSAALIDEAKPCARALVAELLARGQRVLVIDCFLTGEPAGDRERDVKYFTTYNRTDLAERVQDIVTAIGYLRSREEVMRIDIVGAGQAGLWCLLARGLARGSNGLGRTAVDAERFDSTNDREFVNRLFCPHLRAAGDLVTGAALAAPSPLLVHNAGDKFPAAEIRQVYTAAGAGHRLTISSGPTAPEELAKWITAPAQRR